MKDNRWIVTVLFLLLISLHALAQKKKSSSKQVNKPVSKTVIHKQKKATVNTKQKQTITASPKQKKAISKPVTEKNNVENGSEEPQVRAIVAFLEYMLNSLGSNTTTTRDKDVLITESYTKIFRDSKVQVEDDLDEKRNVIIYKDVVAYLKDVDFFYKEVKFEFDIENISSGSIADGKIFYKVSLNRNLKGITPDGKPVNNTTPRFIEINYDPKEQDLKIVSIYTNEFNEKESLINWWSDLSYEWKSIFRNQLNLEDSASLENIRSVTAIETLDLGNNKYIQTISPLTYLLNLRTLNISNTKISDLTPLRNLSELTNLNVSNTNVTDLTPLKYCLNLKKLIINTTPIKEISVVGKMQNLEYLDVAHTKIDDFNVIGDITALKYLNLSDTEINDLTPLQSAIQLHELNISKTNVRNINSLRAMHKITILNIDSTKIKNFEALANLDSLTILYANNTALENLHPMQQLSKLKKIFCDQTYVTKIMADQFLKTNPKVLVINNSKDLNAWWTDLTPSWQNVFMKISNISEKPSKEALANLSAIDSININGNTNIISLEPLQRLQNIRTIEANGTGIHDLSPIKELKNIRHLDISETDVSDLSVLMDFSQLQILKANKTKVENLEPLYELQALKKLYVDHAYIHDIIAHDFLARNKECLIIFKTIHLNRWWNNLQSDWKKEFQRQMGSDTTASTENLHRLIELKKLEIKDAAVKDLSSLTEFIQLTELHFSGTAISDISFLTNIPSLRVLHITHSPLQKAEALKNLHNLEDLDVSSTPIDDLRVIEGLKNIKTLNCSGTQIKKIIVLSQLTELTYLDFSNTNVSNLDAIAHLPLKTLKCYNTKVSNREIESFKNSHPDCNVIYYR